jgi:membrane protein DedA with SNARE-associated domain
VYPVILRLTGGLLCGLLVSHQQTRAVHQMREMIKILISVVIVLVVMLAVGWMTK